jgi:hypothetical protein
MAQWLIAVFECVSGHDWHDENDFNDDPSIPTMDINKNKIAIFFHFAAQRKFCGRILSSPVTDIYALMTIFPLSIWILVDPLM